MVAPLVEELFFAASFIGFIAMDWRCSRSDYSSLLLLCS